MDRPSHSSRDSRPAREPARGRNPRDERPSQGAAAPRTQPRGPENARASAGRAAVPMEVKSGVPHGATESGWWPDLVYTGGKFESGLAFFADAQGRLTRFSREPNDLKIARRLEGQAVLPGLVNAHSRSFQRLWRGREMPVDSTLLRLTDEDLFDTARLVFLEMLLSGITCVGEFHYLRNASHAPADGPASAAREIARAAHDVGIRIALINVAHARGDFRGDATRVSPRIASGTAEIFLRETQSLKATIEKEYPADEVWCGVGVQSLATVPLDHVKVIASFARAERLRFHAQVSASAAENDGCASEYGRTPIALLSDQGIVDKRFTAVEARHLTEDEIKLLGAARAIVCTCPSAEQGAGLGPAPIEKLLAAGAGIALGSDSNVQVDLLKDARLLECHLRVAHQQRTGLSADPAAAWLHAATVTGARSLGATGGALEVGRPADFFTVNLFDPSIVGADANALLATVLFSLERRAIRDVWIGARQRISGGRHVAHGPIVGRFVDLQRRLQTTG